MKLRSILEAKKLLTQDELEAINKQALKDDIRNNEIALQKAIEDGDDESAAEYREILKACRAELNEDMGQTAEASQAYAAHMGAIRQMLTELGKSLDNHAKRQALDKGNWGYAGDLESVAEKLKDVLEGFSQF